MDLGNEIDREMLILGHKVVLDLGMISGPMQFRYSMEGRSLIIYTHEKLSHHPVAAEVG